MRTSPAGKPSGRFHFEAQMLKDQRAIIAELLARAGLPPSPPDGTAGWPPPPVQATAPPQLGNGGQAQSMPPIIPGDMLPFLRAITPDRRR